MAVLQVPVRWYPTVTEPAVRCLEPNGAHLERVWELPAAQTALVMVDCWTTHPIESHLDNSGEIIERVVVPLTEACRSAGISVIHAPSPVQAHLYPQWLRYAGQVELGYLPPAGPADGGSPWPPADFRSRTGAYAGLARPTYLRDVQPYLVERRIVPSLGPQPDDFVIATGAQLHRLCRHREILHLLFVGFATNMCILHRDYGIIAMQQRGYNCVLLRDATVAIEAAETYEARGLTQAAIYQVEMLFGVSSTAADVMTAVRQAADGDGAAQ